jgi:hypothetical protein
MAFVLPPPPASILADDLGWRSIPDEVGPPFKVGAAFDRALAKRQTFFFQTLAEQDGNPGENR